MGNVVASQVFVAKEIHIDPVSPIAPAIAPIDKECLGVWRPEQVNMLIALRYRSFADALERRGHQEICLKYLNFFYDFLPSAHLDAALAVWGWNANRLAEAGFI